MTKQWQAWSSNWDILSQRERVLLSVMALAIPCVLVFIFLIEDNLTLTQKLPAEIKGLEQEVAHQQKLLSVIQSKKLVDPDIAAREELKKLRLALTEENKRIQKAASHLVSPSQMLDMLQSVLAEGAEVRLVKASSLPVERMSLTSQKSDESTTNTEANAAETPEVYIFEHPFEVELEGSYQGVYEYLQRLENLDGVFFWDVISYKVDQYPTAKVKLNVHTLSSEKGWLGA